MLTRLSRWSITFPDPAEALADPNGLLAVGGDLGPRRLESAYRHGIFPWYDDDDGPILWWSPDPRGVLLPGELRVTRSLHKTLRNGGIEVRIDTAFEDVIDACAGPRRGSHGTWITSAMRHAYIEMHHLGHAHSVEAWHEGELVGGLYGLAFGRAFFGESMFSRRTDASKVAFVTLTNVAAALDLAFIDCQLPNPHLETLGVRGVPRATFLRWLHKAEAAPTPLFPRVPPPLEPTPWAR